MKRAIVLALGAAVLALPTLAIPAVRTGAALPQSGTLGYAQIEGFWVAAGGPPSVAAIAAAITGAESSFLPGIIQQGQPYSTTGWGLWQITPGNSVPSQDGQDYQLLDPWNNAEGAVAKYRAAGDTFTPWTTYNDGAYVQFLLSNPPAPATVTDPGQYIPIGSAPAGTHNTSQPGTTFGPAAPSVQTPDYLYLLHADGSVFERPEAPGNCLAATACPGPWSQTDIVAPGHAAVAGSSSYVYELHSDQSVFERPVGPGSCTTTTRCSGWQQVDSVGSGDVGIAAGGGYLYLFHADGSVFERPEAPGNCLAATACPGPWSQTDGVGPGHRAIAGSSSYLYELGTNQSVFERPVGPGSCPTATICTGWQQVDQIGSGDTGIAAGRGYLYLLHADGSVFERAEAPGNCLAATACPGPWSQTDIVGLGHRAITGSSSYLYELHSDQSVFERPVGPGSCTTTTRCSGWEQVDGVGSGDVGIAAGFGS